MYESPLTVSMSDIHKQIEKQTEEQIMLTINQTIGYDVDKLELIKALRYDREQYIKGYRDCKSDMLDRIKQAREEIEDAYEGGNNADEFFDGYDNAIDDCVRILDKLIESEENK